MMEENKNLKADNFVFNVFLVLFCLIYTGMIFKIFLPSQIQEKQITFNWRSKSQGMVAGASTINNNDSGIINSLGQIGINFVVNVKDSVGF